MKGLLRIVERVEYQNTPHVNSPFYKTAILNRTKTVYVLGVKVVEKAMGAVELQDDSR